MIINIDKLNQWAKEIHDNATAHGWHEEKHSPEHWLSLVMCEVAEAIEADRKGLLYSKTIVCYATDSSFCDWYNQNVKGFGEEEFADIVIRLLDMAYELHGDNFQWETYTCQIDGPRRFYSFTKNALSLVVNFLGSDIRDICSSIEYVYCWAEILGIDLDQHIEWKMRYNKARPYKHGGKKY